MNKAHQVPVELLLPQEPKDGRILLELMLLLSAKARAEEQAWLAHYRDPWKTKQFDWIG